MSDNSLANVLSLVQLYTARSLVTVICVLANVGCILNLFVFRSRSLRKSPCSLYFLASSCANIIMINFGCLSYILKYGYQFDSTANNDLYCKMRNYLLNAFGFISQSYIVLACVDRYLVSCASVLRRQWSSLRTAALSTSLVGLFWIGESIHLAIISEIAPGPFCYFRAGFYPLFISVHNMVLSGFVLPGIMGFFGTLTLKNVRKIRLQARTLNRQDYNLIKMLVCQVVFNAVFSVLYTLGLVYLAYATRQTGPKTANDYAVQSFISYVAIACYFMPFCTSFYIYTLTAPAFRQELIKIINHVFGRHPHSQNVTAIAIAQVGQRERVAQTAIH